MRAAPGLTPVQKIGQQVNRGAPNDHHQEDPGPTRQDRRGWRRMTAEQMARVFLDALRECETEPGAWIYSDNPADCTIDGYFNVVAAMERLLERMKSSPPS